MKHIKQNETSKRIIMVKNKIHHLYHIKTIKKKLGQKCAGKAPAHKRQCEIF